MAAEHALCVHVLGHACPQVHTQVVAAAQVAAALQQERAAKQADTLTQALEGARGESSLIAELRKEQVWVLRTGWRAAPTVQRPPECTWQWPAARNRAMWESVLGCAHSALQSGSAPLCPAYALHARPVCSPSTQSPCALVAIPDSCPATRLVLTVLTHTAPHQVAVWDGAAGGSMRIQCACTQGCFFLWDGVP